MRALLATVILLTASTVRAAPAVETDGDGAAWVTLPSGRFEMGCSPGDAHCAAAEKPRHTVTVPSFQLMAYEVTQGQWTARMGSNPSYFASCGVHCPVEQISREEAEVYCKRVNGRLPTEAEWEYAARAGTTTPIYTGTLTIDRDHHGQEMTPIGWYAGNSKVAYRGGMKCADWSTNRVPDRRCGTHEVGQKRPNAFGLYDMLGNVDEVVADPYNDAGYAGAPADGSAWAGGRSNLFVRRGGGWNSRAMDMAVSRRARAAVAWTGDWDGGVRCARDIGAPKATKPQPQPRPAARTATAPAGIAWVKSAPANAELTRSEITVAQYRACVTAKACSPPSGHGDCNWAHADREDHPVNCVTHRQAAEVCAWAGGRLPAESEWVAEASSAGARAFPWGDDEPTCDRAVFEDGCKPTSTAPVCSRPAGNSVSGLCDMAGNVAEWMDPGAGAMRILRGGSRSYVYARSAMRAVRRVYATPDTKLDENGVRCAR
jgi:formylglycine-generating enzyme required for sulfatase activity